MWPPVLPTYYRNTHKLMISSVPVVAVVALDSPDIAHVSKRFIDKKAA